MAKSSKQERCLIFYHGNDWDGVPSRQRYLMSELSRYIPIIYLDGGNDGRGQVTVRKVEENVTVVRGLISIFVALQRRGILPLSPFFACWHLKWIYKKYERVLFWNMENWLRPYRYIRYDGLIFDAIDPAFDRRPPVLLAFEEREVSVLRVADKVFATAQSLADFCSQHNENVSLLNNACAPEEYSEELLACVAQPQWWPEAECAQQNRPIAAYLGTIDERFDFECAFSAARENQEIQFVFAGQVVPALVAKTKELNSLPNVICPGRISVDDGRYLLSHCTIGLIPFAMGEMNDAVNPVKMYAYALMGKPMVGTATREMCSRLDTVVTARTPTQFSQAVKEAIALSQDTEYSKKLRAYALNNTWEHRAAKAWEEIRGL